MTPHIVPRLDRVAEVAEARVRGDRRLRVTGHLDLGHDRHESVARVGDDLADVVLRVEAAVSLLVVDVAFDVSRSDVPTSVRSRHAPTSVSRGYFLISMRQPWSSVRCQWKVFILCSARRSMYFLTNSFGMKWRETSRCMPRHEKRGRSSIVDGGNRPRSTPTPAPSR